ncbi:MAG: hypothetical protein AB7I27_06655 [Bacteriovoracaceae bacterium]
MNSLNSNEISCTYWDTPVSSLETLRLSNQLHTGSNNYFFFENGLYDSARFIYVLTIRSLDAFKISDESDSSVRISKLLDNRLPENRKWARSYKIWNSPYALEASYTLGMTSKEYDEMEKFQYLIVTQDVAVEFVTSMSPKWDVYKEGNLEELVIQSFKKDA